MPEHGKRMGRKGKLAIWLCVAAVVGAGVAFLIVSHRPPHELTLNGAVLRQDADPAKRTPIADAKITAAYGSIVVSARSDSSGAFRLILRNKSNVKRTQFVTLTFEHPGYRSLELTVEPSDKIYVAAMVPIHNEKPTGPHQAPVKIANVSVRYSVQSTTTLEVGSAVKTFEVVNTGNVPCNGHEPCSPDGRWRAAIASASLDAGEQNEFRNARVSCVAGPCPFTKIESDQFSKGGRNISVAVLDWSDTATFLLEAEVVRSTRSDIVRISYPVILGEQLNFSLPAEGTGPSIEAELDGNRIVFPLGPSLCLTWANCKLTADQNNSQLYRCALKPGYTF